MGEKRTAESKEEVSKPAVDSAVPQKKRDKKAAEKVEQKLDSKLIVADS